MKGEGSAFDWKADVLKQKDDDPDAVVLLGITTDIDLEDHLCLPYESMQPEKSPIRQLVEVMDHALIGSICAPSWAPFFEEAADLVLAQCAVYVPQ